jgi:hypothetical protein
MLQQQLQGGADIFDKRYQAIPGSKPTKYHTAYDEKLAGLVQPHYDAWCGMSWAGVSVCWWIPMATPQPTTAGIASP